MRPADGRRRARPASTDGRQPTLVLDDDARADRAGLGRVGRVVADAATSRSATTTTPRRRRPRSSRSTASAGCSPATWPPSTTDGTIQLLGRGSMCINTGGEKVFPEEVEGALIGHPTVYDALVVGVPDERWGERVAAVVQPRRRRRRRSSELVDALPGAARRLQGARAWSSSTRSCARPSGKADYRWAHRRVAEKQSARGATRRCDGQGSRRLPVARSGQPGEDVVELGARRGRRRGSSGPSPRFGWSCSRRATRRAQGHAPLVERTRSPRGPSPWWGIPAGVAGSGAEPGPRCPAAPSGRGSSTATPSAERGGGGTSTSRPGVRLIHPAAAVAIAFLHPLDHRTSSLLVELDDDRLAGGHPANLGSRAWTSPTPSDTIETQVIEHEPAPAALRAARRCRRARPGGGHRRAARRCGGGAPAHGGRNRRGLRPGRTARPAGARRRGAGRQHRHPGPHAHTGRVHRRRCAPPSTVSSPSSAPTGPCSAPG